MSYDFYASQQYTDNLKVRDITLPNTFTKAGDIPVVNSSGVLNLTTLQFVTGPSSSTTNNVAIFSDTTGQIIKNSTVGINSGVITASGLTLNNLVYPAVDGIAGSVITTNGANQLSFSSTALPNPSFLYASMTTTQTTNLSVNDHLKFNNVIYNKGTGISLNTTSPYSIVTGAASIGRFTITTVDTFKLELSLIFINFVDFSGSLTLQWYNTTTNTAVGNSILLNSSNNKNCGCGSFSAIITNTTTSSYECRITGVSRISNIQLAEANVVDLNSL